MTKNTKKNDTTLIGCGYWGTNIAKALTKLKKNKIIIYDENRSNSLILKKRFPDKTIISKCRTVRETYFMGNSRCAVRYTMCVYVCACFFF